MDKVLRLYDSVHYWDNDDMLYEVEDDNKYEIDGYEQRHKSSQGWHVSEEISGATKDAIGFLVQWVNNVKTSLMV